MEPDDAGMDILLGRSLVAPVPSLPPNFERRVIREVRRDSRSLGRYRWMLLTGYGLISAVTSAVLMRGAGLDWGAIAGILAPLSLIAAAYPAWRATGRNL